MSLDFKPGCYSVNTGKTFLNLSDAGHDYYTLQFNSTLESSLPSRKASLRQKKGTYYADWAWADKVLSYEGTEGNLQELECLLVYDEETHTFTLERPSVKMSMKKARKKKHPGSATENLSVPPSSALNGQPRPIKVKSGQASKPVVTPFKQPSSIAESYSVQKKLSPNGLTSPIVAHDNPTINHQQVPISLALPPVKQQQPQQKDTQRVPSPANTSNDSFDVDILSDMDEILNSDEDDDDTFETILPPPLHIETAAPNHSPQPKNLHSPSIPPIQTSGKRRRPALKMASAPIRRLDASPPTPAPVLLNRPTQDHKSHSTPSNHRHKVQPLESSSSDGSSSSDDDESGSSTDGSSVSTSDDDDDDDDMDLLVENISRGLSEEDTPPITSSFVSLPPRSGPRSLRDLLDGHHRDDDDVSSSGSDDDV